MWKGNYKNGKEEGAWVSYNKGGTVWERFSGTFKDGVKISD
jgi:antitoxin component YwqK of YwqJK toxin-antitoxin module